LINCQQAKELISQKLDGALHPSDEKRLEEHLNTCSSCQVYQEEMKELHHQLLQLPPAALKESMVDQLLETHLLHEVKQQKKISFWKKKHWIGLTAAAVLLGLWVPLYALISNEFPGLLQGGLKQEGPMMASDSVKQELEINHDTGAQEENFAGIMEATPTENDPQVINEKTDPYAYQVKEENRQLVIYQNEEVIYRSRHWEDDQSVQWRMENQHQLIYTLYSSKGKVVATYQIDLLQKKEEKRKE